MADELLDMVEALQLPELITTPSRYNLFLSRTRKLVDVWSFRGRSGMVIIANWCRAFTALMFFERLLS